MSRVMESASWVETDGSGGGTGDTDGETEGLLLRGEPSWRGMEEPKMAAP